MADKDTPYSAEWANNLKHRADPNRVALDQPRPFIESTSTTNALNAPKENKSAEPGYYDIPLLAAPVWKWEIASYFFLGGLSAGAYVLGRAADRFGGRDYRDVTRLGAYIAMAALLPSPPLLIHDLGDPKRFHHMLRVWKPGSPMNLGTWALTAYAGMATFEVVRQYLQERGERLGNADRSKLLKLMNNGTLLLLHDLAGVPFAMLVVSYTGVLLSCTSNPLWSKNPWISPLFTASAISTGAEAISLVLDCIPSHRDGRSGESPAHKVLRRVDTVAHAVEGIAMAGFSRHAGEKAATLHTGKMSRYHKFTVRGVVAAEILKLLPLDGGLLKFARMIWNLLGLSAGWSMRWSFIYGGHEAANDPRTSRLASKPSAKEPISQQKPDIKRAEQFASSTGRADAGG